MQASIDALCAGEVVLLPTDTVYGLAAIPSKESCAEISRLKGRSANQPIAWLVNNNLFLQFAQDIPDYAKRLIDEFWPGALTLVVEASEDAHEFGCVPEDGTLAMRCPDNEFCLDIINALKNPLACTSANKHGKQAPFLREEIDSSFLHLAKDSLPQRCAGNIASTIVDCTGRLPFILREGSIDANAIERACGLNVKLAKKS